MNHERNQRWRENFQKAAGENGFFEELSHEHRALFVPKGNVLVVAFENLDDARQNPDNRLPWGMDFLTSRGWSALGIMAHGHTWYRDPAIARFFDRLREEGFFEQFKRVVFYGVSMGGYAATAYASACPGSDVLVVNPQATLSRDVTLGWETRFKPAWKRDYDGPYGFGPDGVRQARKVRIFYDPKIAADALHVALYQGSNIEKYRCRHHGHGMLTTWRHMGVLSQIITGCIEDTLTQQEIYTLLTARKRNPFFQKRMLNYLLTTGRPYWLAQYCNAVLEDCKPQKRPKFLRNKNEANEVLIKQGKPPV